MARALEWEIKVTKLCNLRCAYCYEYDELGDPHRLSLKEWRAILDSARWYHETIALRNPDEPVTTRFVWHGGESSVLPLSYYQKVLALQRGVLAGIDFVNHVPTNLFRIKPELLAFWDREGFVMAVSYDGAPGPRVTLGGENSDAVVAANLRKLLATPRLIGLNSVLTGANLPHLIDIYERLRALVHNSAGSLYWNLIPLHATSTDHPRTVPYRLDPTEAVAGLLKLFNHWLDDEQPVPVLPLKPYYFAVVRKLLDTPQRRFPRREFGETSLMVNTDGQLYLYRDAYDLGEIPGLPLRTAVASSDQEHRLRGKPGSDGPGNRRCLRRLPVRRSMQSCSSDPRSGRSPRRTLRRNLCLDAGDRTGGARPGNRRAGAPCHPATCGGLNGTDDDHYRGIGAGRHTGAAAAPGCLPR